MLRPWLPVALTAALLLVLEAAVLIWPSDRLGPITTNAIGGWAGLFALGLVWTVGIVFSLARSVAQREPLWALSAVVSSIVGLVYISEWARRVALPTQGGISSGEVLEGMFPFVGRPALFAFAIASLLVLAYIAVARARLGHGSVSAKATGVAPPRV